MRLLLVNGFSPNEILKEGEPMPIERALSNSEPSWVIQELVDYGAETNFKTQDDSPFLHEAILNCESDALVSVLKSDTDITVKDAEGKTALFKAVSTGEKKKVEQLILHGAEGKLVDESGRNYLHLSQIFGDNPELTEYFLKYELDPQALTKDGKNSLDLALEYSRIASAKVLIKNRTVSTKETFDRLFNAGNREAIGLLVKSAQVDPNAAVSNGDTILIDALKQEDAVMVKLLLEQGADANLSGGDREPPISYATALHNYECMKLLLEAGADPNIEFQSPPASRFEEIIKTEGAIKWFIERDPGITPIMMACDQGFLENVVLLREHGAENHGSKKYRFWPGNFAARRSITDIVQYMVGAEPGSRERTVTVDLSQQRATVYDKDKKTVMSFRISSGKKHWICSGLPCIPRMYPMPEFICL